jgi:tripartite-type tricarboxylate transporter receptor subunit TctC
MFDKINLTRRNLLAAGSASLAAASFARPSWGQSFPSRNISITTATAEGSGADRDGRNFSAVWGKYIDTNFEFSFFPGAAGQVGYEHYLQRVAKDPHNIMNCYIGPEVIMLTLQAPHIKPGVDIIYFQQFITEPMSIFVGRDSPIESIEQLVDLGRQRTVNISKSRLPHPASICTLVLGEATGADFHLIPFGGGNPATMAAIGGEVDACALPIGSPLLQGEWVRILGVFAETNPVPERSNNAPTVNDALGLDVPSLTSSRSWAIHGETLERYPEEMEIIIATMQQTLADPEFEERQVAAGMSPEFINIGGQDVAMASARATAELAERYRDLLTAA